jgi:enoyl-CoA hydratase
MPYTNIIVEKKQGIAKIKINRPKVLNALNNETINEIIKAIDEIEEDQKIKTVIFTGEGKAFIAGADISQMANMTSLQGKKFSELGHHMLDRIEKSRLIFIAAVNGFALGGGCETLMAMDIVIASKHAKMGQPEINLGICPGFGGTQRLPRIVGRMKAKELLLTGRNIDAEEALKIGLVNMVVDAENLMVITEKVADQIACKSSIQTQFIKELVNKGIEVDLHTGNALEISFFSASFATHDQKEGMKAFLEKRKPDFKGK